MNDGEKTLGPIYLFPAEIRDVLWSIDARRGRLYGLDSSYQPNIQRLDNAEKKLRGLLELDERRERERKAGQGELTATAVLKQIGKLAAEFEKAQGGQ